MKKLFLLSIALLVIFVTSATEPVVPSANANQILIPIGKTGKKLSLMELAQIKSSELESLTGKKMSLAERMSFFVSQKKLRKSISEDGTINKKKYNKFFSKRYGPEAGFHGIGFILGFFLGALGVVLAYVINEDADKKNRVKWAWIGFGLALVMSIALYIVILASLA